MKVLPLRFMTMNILFCLLSAGSWVLGASGCIMMANGCLIKDLALLATHMPAEVVPFFFFLAIALESGNKNAGEGLKKLFKVS
ncbi:hypothetical protein XELAEV_18026152mg [Xenopus laevis]|uniref:Uncharacterized protein n=1 Tax=Xenopus laevis TaxID=8355 RepID=A0A974HIQ2_XENLA|nr:hypothetical protein XELAEV_18026152mg [Xenopus laevis]